jgi:putative nucleotidyltransferase with HDIG domain
VTKLRFEDFINKLKNIERSKAIRNALYSSIAVILYLAMLNNVIPEKLNVELYSIAEKDILSPIQIKDLEETRAKETEAAESVSAQYTYHSDKALTQIIKIQDIFEAVTELNRSVVNEGEDGIEEENGEENEEVEPQELSSDEKVNQLRDQIPELSSDEISTGTLETLFNATASELSFAKDVTINAVNKVMENNIKIDEIQQYKQAVKDEIPGSGLSIPLQSALKDLAGSAIAANYLFDATLTKERRDQIVSSVDPVIIRENQMLVRKGQRIDQEMLDQLALVGLLESDFNPSPYVGLALLVLLLTMVVIYFIKDIPTEKRHLNSNLMMYVFVLFLTILIIKVTSMVSVLGFGIGFIVPVAIGTMMLKMLLNEQVALISSIIFGVCGSIMYNVDTTGPFHFTYGLYILLSSLAGIVFLGKRSVKSNILKTGMWIALINAIVVLIILALSKGQYDLWQISSNVGFSLISGFLSAVLTIGLIPFFEAGFGILSSLKLIELSNPNHPLLRKILIEAPGTYHHSVVVANLAEAACEAVDANGLLARVGAYYHDLGKTKRPHFFIENQLNMGNPHDKIAPQLSKTIITAHPYDGAEMLREYKLPKEIVDIAEQHHGTTLLKFFYHKANQQSDKEISESEFRYPGPKARSRESAIVGIADAVEAAVRSLAKPTPVKIEQLVRKIVADRLEDGQFNECDLTFKELETITVTICETLQGMFHQRIEYPEEVKKKVSQA